jgi:hypothetical protein
MKKVILLALLLPISAFCAEVSVTVGMKINDALAIIRNHGGEDVQKHLSISKPVPNVYWSLKDYAAAIAIRGDNGKVSEILKCDSVSGFKRGEDRSVKGLTFDRKNKKLTVQEFDDKPKAPPKTKSKT